MGGERKEKQMGEKKETGMLGKRRGGLAWLRKNRDIALLAIKERLNGSRPTKAMDREIAAMLGRYASAAGIALSAKSVALFRYSEGLKAFEKAAPPAPPAEEQPVDTGKDAVVAATTRLSTIADRCTADRLQTAAPEFYGFLAYHGPEALGAFCRAVLALSNRETKGGEA